MIKKIALGDDHKRFSKWYAVYTFLYHEKVKIWLMRIWIVVTYLLFYLIFLKDFKNT